MLVGNYSGILSPKRRTAIPKKFLTELGSKVIIAKWYEGCLVIVATSTWKALLERITGEARVITEGVRDTDRFILGSAYELTADSQGRVVIPASLVSYATLGSQIVFLGLGDRVEVWDEAAWGEREKFIASHAGEFVEGLAHKNEKR
jgi:MraZ protein